MIEQIWNELLFWGVWLIIPLVIDIFSGVHACLIVVKSKKHKEADAVLEYYPDVTIIVPVFNSAQTLKLCMESIENQDYPKKRIEVLVINNGSEDDSYDLYCDIQSSCKLKMWWLDASKGKAKALNKGLYTANGKYIINIDSDGVLEKNAIRRMVYKFENNPGIDALTGVILIDYEQIKKNEGYFKRFMQKCEIFEYSQAFLVGRAYEASKGKMFTLAGAYSAFRKDVVLKTQLYNGETLGEDTHMTMQIREFSNGTIELCEDAYFLVDPIESMDKLYIQRQRWQRGEIEVSALFQTTSKKLTNVLRYTLIKDHTLLFPRLIWMFATVYLIFIDYPMELIVGANVMLYIGYLINDLLFYRVGLLCLQNMESYRSYMKKNWYILLLLPLYRTILFFVRAAGVINAVEANASWNTRTLTDEKKLFEEYARKKLIWYSEIKRWVNNE